MSVYIYIYIFEVLLPVNCVPFFCSRNLPKNSAPGHTGKDTQAIPQCGELVRSVFRYTVSLV